MNIVILGYYNRKNLGDDLFQHMFDKFFEARYPHAKILYINPDDVKRISSDTDIVIVGGGDIINNYFMEKISKLVEGLRCPIYAIGVGFPYPQLITSEYLDVFDVIVTRTKSIYPKLQEIMPGRSFYCPDLVRLMKPIPQKKTSNRVGIFFASSICSLDSPLIQKLADIVNGIACISGKGCGNKAYHVILYAMNTSNSLKEDDNRINKEIYKHVLYNNVTIETQEIKPENVLNVFSNLHAAVCTRFHAHVLCLMTGIPFVSLYSTNKVKDLLEAEGLLHRGVEMLVDHDTLKPISFNPQAVLRRFNSLSVKNTSYKNVDKELNAMENGINNLMFYKPRYGSKLYRHTLHSIHKYIGDNTNFSQMNSDDLDFVSKAITFAITRKTDDVFTWGLRQNLAKEDFSLKESIKWILGGVTKPFDNWDSKIPMDQRIYNFKYFDPNILKGLHRSGWQYVVGVLNDYTNPDGVIFDPYLDKTFGWEGEFYERCGILPFRKRWMGVFHHTQNESYSANNIKAIVESDVFKKSLKKCEGIVVLSQNLKNWLQTKIHVPIHVLYHPTEFPTKLWKYKLWKENVNKKVIHVGAWLRNCYSIYALPSPINVKKCILKGKNMENYFPPYNFLNDLQKAYNVELYDGMGICREGRQKGNKFIVGMIDHIKEEVTKVEVIETLSDEEYDDLLTNNIVFLDLIDVSACNTLIECIVRNTPIVINRLPAIVEYLGEDYPLYYNTLEEATSLINDDRKILEAYRYLKTKDKEFLKMETFMKKFLEI